MKIDVRVPTLSDSVASGTLLPWRKQVGDTVARVRELEHIRQFLTSNSVTVLLDVLFTVVFLGVMWCYSSVLTLVVVASLPLYALLSLVITPIIRQRLNEKFNRGAEN